MRGGQLSPFFGVCLGYCWKSELYILQSVCQPAGQETPGAPASAHTAVWRCMLLWPPLRGPGRVTCWYAGLLLRSCSTALAYAALTQMAGWSSFLVPFSLFGLVALKYPAGHKECTVSAGASMAAQSGLLRRMTCHAQILCSHMLEMPVYRCVCAAMPVSLSAVAIISLVSVRTVVCECNNPGAFWHALLLWRVDLQIPCLLHEADDHRRIKPPPAQEIALIPLVALAESPSFTNALPMSF